MQPSSAAFSLAKVSEGLRLVSYQNAGDRPTNGWGHTDGVVLGTVITEEQAEAFLAADMAEAAKAVNALVKVALTQGQFDALCDFVFQFGLPKFQSSTLLRLLNAGQYEQAAGQFKYWILVNGHPNAGLIKRRAAEAAMFLANPFAGVTGAAETHLNS